MRKYIKYFVSVMILFFIIVINCNVVNATLDISLSENEYKEYLKRESTGKVYTITKESNTITEVDKETLVQNISVKFKSNNQVQTTTSGFKKENILTTANVRTIHPNAGNLIRMYRPFYSPYNNVCKITTAQGEGSGYLVGPNLLLTAAHCFFDEDGNILDNWTCYPSYEYGMYNNLRSGWQEATFGDWASSGSAQGDWCVVRLDWNMGDEIGWIGCQSYGTNAEMNEMVVHSAGYPNTDQNDVNNYTYITQIYNGECQYYSPGNISQTYNGHFEMSAYPVFGMSGGPIVNWSTDMAVGINHAMLNNVKTGIGCRIHQEIINVILSYM